MSQARSSKFKYTCFNDCEQAGCPGHELQFVRDRSTDYYSVEIDGRSEYFDQNQFMTMLAYEDSLDKDRGAGCD